MSQKLKVLQISKLHFFLEHILALGNDLFVTRFQPKCYLNFFATTFIRFICS